MKLLEGKIALVAGATRGAGRGIACMLGELGATVYCTGRSTRAQLASGKNRPETIEETAEMVTQKGGEGIWVQTDHTQENQVRDLVDKIREEQGKLNILINDVWGGDALTEWGKPTWELELKKGRTMYDRAVISHILTSRWAIPLLMEKENGLVIEITDGNEFTNAHYRGNLFYDLVKSTGIRLAKALAQEFRDTTHTALAISPGFLRSEAMLDLFEVSESNWEDGIEKDPHFAQSETPNYLGRGIAALAADPQKRIYNGKALSSWELAEIYDLKDVDGRQPHWGKYMERNIPPFLDKIRIELEQQATTHELNAENINIDEASLNIEVPLSNNRIFSYSLTPIDIFFSKPDSLVKNFLEQFQSLTS